MRYIHFVLSLLLLYYYDEGMIFNFYNQNRRFVAHLIEIKLSDHRLSLKFYLV